MRIGLVGCVKTKQQAPAAELYTSALFRGRWTAVEASCDHWWVLSAQHGLVAPDQVLEPYDAALAAVPVAERRLWAARVLAELEEQLGRLDGHRFELHAGSAYVDFGLVAGLRAAGAAVELPVAGLGLGEQLAWYRAAAREIGVPNLVVRRQRPPPAAHDKALRPTGFDEIEVLLSIGLPASARRHRAWWANDATRSQARSWLGVGYRVDAVDQDRAWVRFRRDTRS